MHMHAIGADLQQHDAPLIDETLDRLLLLAPVVQQRPRGVDPYLYPALFVVVELLASREAVEADLSQKVKLSQPVGE